jgi:hypothetical protein
MVWRVRRKHRSGIGPIGRIRVIPRRCRRRSYSRRMPQAGCFPVWSPANTSMRCRPQIPGNLLRSHPADCKSLSVNNRARGISVAIHADSTTANNEAQPTSAKSPQRDCLCYSNVGASTFMPHERFHYNRIEATRPSIPAKVRYLAFEVPANVYAYLDNPNAPLAPSPIGHAFIARPGATVYFGDYVLVGSKTIELRQDIEAARTGARALLPPDTILEPAEQTTAARARIPLCTP